jgi:UPF0271 protein
MPSDPMEERFVLDTSAILSRKYDLSSSRFYVTNSILKEIEKGKISRYLKMAETSLNIVDPGTDAIVKVKNAAKKTGDINRLSPTDIEALALALQIGAVLVTDDYSMQNVSSILSVKAVSASIREIDKVIEWVYRCTGCGRTYDRNYGNCRICGHALKNYPKKTSKIQEKGEKPSHTN